jgi:CubicO group peptidase (beta-lactamase class C family)
VTSPRPTPEPTELAAIVDPHFDRALAAGSCPGLAYAVLVDGQVRHSRGLGTTTAGADTVPDEHTGFRIASMTKSFTAATVLGLRDERLLQLDEPVVRWVRELTAGGPAAESITVRHLLTMGAGYCTDDPWGDRQQDLEIDAFRALLAAGVAPVLQPGDRFEYSNTGFAILGLVISAVTGMPFVDAVHRRVLEPLGMRATGFTSEVVGRMATGYVKRTDGWHEEPLAAPGAFSPMGGVISTLDDLARWVGFFQRGLGEPLMSHLSLREMQRAQRVVGAVSALAADQPPSVTGYGFGLFEELRPWGRSVQHSGGYPGFGSHMRWHPASGLGIVALANGTYAPMATVATAALEELVTELGCETVVPMPQVDGLQAAVAAVESWLTASDPDGPEGQALRELWADNVERDLPWAERLTSLRSLHDRFGTLRELPGTRQRPDAASVTWDLRGDRPVVDDEGHEQVVRVVVMVAPHDTGRVQAVALRHVSQVPRPASTLLS